MEDFSRQTVNSSITSGTLVTYIRTVISLYDTVCGGGIDQLWVTLVWRQNDPLNGIIAYYQTKAVCSKFPGSSFRKLFTV
jgi:hypothetical protein